MPVEQLLFTDWPRGKGVDPAATGFQIKACSAGLNDDTRRQLATICMHHGQAFALSYAPRVAIEREQEWLTRTDSRQRVPDEVLAVFPVIWSYDQLAHDQFALTRVQYTCLTHDGRTGNFLAHALVFVPDELAAHGYNPLAFRESALFSSGAAGDDSTLPTLADLGAPSGEPPRYALLLHEPYRQRLAALISALCTATPSTRPLLICLADWRDSAAFVEALVSLLPPAARCRTTISTYESDRTWLMPGRAGRPSGLAAARHLLVLCGADDRAFGLRPDEYHSVYAVFNFVADRYSELAAPRPFAMFAAECALEGRLDRLARHHALAEQLGAAHDSAAWDALVPAAALADAHPSPQSIVVAVQALANLSAHPRQAQAMLDLLAPSIRALAQAGDATTLTGIAADLSMLLDRAAEEHPLKVELQALARQAFVCGQGRAATALLRAGARDRDAALIAMLGAASDEPLALPAEELNADDRIAMLNLILDGLRFAEQSSDAAATSNQLLAFAFRCAHSLGMAAELWERIGAMLVKPRLNGEWNAEQLRLARELLGYAPADRCPEAHAWLSLRLLAAAQPKGAELGALLAGAASSGARVSGAAAHLAELQRIVQERIADGDQRVIALGRIAEATYGTASWREAFAAYQDAIRQTKPERRPAVHQRLAEAGAAHVLCEELIALLLPWNVDDSPKILHRWRELVLQPRPLIFDALRSRVAALLHEPALVERVLPLARELLPRQRAETAAAPGLAALAGAIVLALPLEPLPDKWQQPLAVIADTLPSQAGTRLRVLRFMREIQQRAGAPGWSVKEFPSDDAAWSRDLPQLDPTECDHVLAWCIGAFATVGVTTPDEARAFVRLLTAAGRHAPQQIAAMVAWLLDRRDAVTCVLVATAFADCALEETRQPEAWTALLRAILDRFDRDARRLFDAHLTHRFRRASQKSDQHLEQLRVAVGLAAPGVGAFTRAAGADAHPAPDRQLGVAGILDNAKRQWRKLLGGSDAPDEVAGHQDKDAPERH